MTNVGVLTQKARDKTCPYCGGLGGSHYSLLCPSLGDALKAAMKRGHASRGSRDRLTGRK